MLLHDVVGIGGGADKIATRLKVGCDVGQHLLGLRQRFERVVQGELAADQVDLEVRSLQHAAQLDFGAVGGHELGTEDAAALFAPQSTVALLAVFDGCGRNICAHDVFYVATLPLEQVATLATAQVQHRHRVRPATVGSHLDQPNQQTSLDHHTNRSLPSLSIIFLEKHAIWSWQVVTITGLKNSFQNVNNFFLSLAGTKQFIPRKLLQI